MAELNRPALQRYHSGPVIKGQPGKMISKWLYGTTDPIADVLKADYFNKAFKDFGKGDIIEMVCNFDVKPELKLVVVTALEDGKVSVEAAK